MDFTSVEGLEKALQLATDVASKFVDATSGIIEAFEPFVPVVITALEKLAELDSETLVDTGNILGISKLIVNLTPGIGALGDAISGVGSIFSTALSGATLLAVTGGFTGLGAAITALSTVLAPLAPVLLAAGGALLAFQFKDEIFTGLQKFGNFVVDAASSLFGLEDAEAAATISSNKLTEAVVNLRMKTGDATITAQNYAQKLQETSAAAGDIGKGLGTAESSVDNLNDAINEARGSVERFNELTLAEEFGDAADEATKQWREFEAFFFAFFQDTNITIDEAVRGFVRLRESIAGTPEDFQDAALKRFLEELEQRAPLTFSKLEEVLKDTKIAGEDLQDSFLLTEESLKKLGSTGVKELEEYIIKAQDAGLSTEQIKARVEDMGLSFKKAASEIDIADEKLAEIQSRERIAFFEAQVELNIAKLENDAQRFGDALDAAVQSADTSAELIKEALAILSDDSQFGDLEAGRVLREELKNRSELIEAQLDLINAEIERNEAIARRLEAGDFSINIQADGLEPELEAFMFRIIERVQATASANAAEFLLGFNPSS